MTIKERLQEEFGCAISAVLGDLENKEDTELLNVVDQATLKEIARKVAFYIDAR